MSGLKLLSAYCSDSDGGEDEQSSPKRLKFPLPASLNLNESSTEDEDDPDLHGGRKRSYPHERGNWSSLIYVAYKKNEAFELFCEQITEVTLPELTLIKINDPHISLSKTFVLYYHWIQEFYSSLKDQLKFVHSFDISFNNIGIYSNEELSRTFIALTVGLGSKELSSSIKIIDKCLLDYKLKPYYEEPSFHMSIAWCLGNKKKILEDEMHKFIKIFDNFKENTCFSLAINNFVFKTGFKEFRLELK